MQYIYLNFRKNTTQSFSHWS